MALDMAKYRRIFLEEATDHLGEISRALLDLEKEMSNAPAIDTIGISMPPWSSGPGTAEISAAITCGAASRQSPQTIWGTRNRDIIVEVMQENPCVRRDARGRAGAPA